ILIYRPGVEEDREKVDHQQAAKGGEYRWRNHIQERKGDYRENKQSREPVGHLYGIFMCCTYQGAALTEVGHLPVKLTEICPSLMVYKGFRDEPQAESRFADPYAELNVFRIAVEEKATSAFEYNPGYSHIKAPLLKPA